MTGEMTGGSGTVTDWPSSRLGRWRGSWRVAVRMARRDLRRHKGRSVLVFVMVSVPVALLVGAACAATTSSVTGAEVIPAQMGSGQALVVGPAPEVVRQGPDYSTASWSATDAESIPGYLPEPGNEESLSRFLGGRAVPVAETEARWLEGDRRVRVSGLVVDGAAVDLGPKARLNSGRWGAESGEIVVTPAGIRKGMPQRGGAVLSVEGVTHDVTVVGTGTALDASGRQPDFVVPSTWGEPAETWWILVRDAPVSWEEVRRLNEYGLAVSSAAVLRDPPADSELPPEIAADLSYRDNGTRQVVAVGAVILFLIVTLLVAPAFAVSAARQRRTLALAASNGAETRQLRRSVLAQALLLGVLAALGGALVGIAAARAGQLLWARFDPASSVVAAPFDVPWSAVAIILGCAVLSSLIAALIPALRLGRLDIVGVMRGQSVSPRLNRVLPGLGVVAAVAGGLGLVAVVRSGGNELGVAAAAVALVLGSLLVVPALLVLAGRLAARLPVGPRMATRDAARHRSRSTPTVAAILAGVVLLTAFSIGLASDTAQQQREYAPRTIAGEGIINAHDEDSRATARSALRSVGAGLIVTPMRVVADEDPWLEEPPPDGQVTTRFVAALPPRCSVADLNGGTADSQRCSVLGYQAAQIVALPIAEIARRLDLTSAQRDLVERGAMVVAAPSLSALPSVDVVTGSVTIDPQSDEEGAPVAEKRTTVPVLAAPARARLDGSFPDHVGALVSDRTAEQSGWPLQESALLLRDPEGPISAQTQTALDDRLDDEGLYAERGFQRYDEIVMRVMFAVAAALILVVTLISTALSLSEQQSDLGTLAAVGATRGTRRRFAASQAMVIGFLGAVLGVVVGLAPGIAVAYPLTARSWDPVDGTERLVDPAVVIPWLPLVAVVVGVPLLAGLLSAAAIRRAPAMTRRAD